MPDGDLTSIRAEFVFVADAAQAGGGKFHALGGGWSRLQLPGPDEPSLPFFVVVSILVPWSRTNSPFGLRIEIRDADGQVLDELASRDAVEQGRPPGLRPGSDQRLMVALPVQPSELEPGVYSVVALVDGAESNSTSFEAVPGADHAL